MKYSLINRVSKITLFNKKPVKIITVAQTLQNHPCCSFLISHSYFVRNLHPNLSRNFHLVAPRPHTAHRTYDVEISRLNHRKHFQKLEIWHVNLTISLHSAHFVFVKCVAANKFVFDIIRFGAISLRQLRGKINDNKHDLRLKSNIINFTMRRIVAIKAAVAIIIIP